LFVKSFPVLSRGFEIEAELTIHAAENQLALTSIPVAFRNRPEDSVSTLNTFRDGIKIIGTILRLYKNHKPLIFFGTIALLLFVIATVFFIPVFITYIKISAVPNYPTLIVCGFVTIAALQCLFTGLMLSTLKQNSLHDFEYRLIDVQNTYTGKKA
jgi:hypothetical protein